MLLSSIRRAQAEHYTWGDACDGWHLLNSQELSVIEERMPPHTAECRHVHGKADQFFYILSGEAQMEIEDQLVTLSARSGTFIEHGRPHKISNRLVNGKDTAGEAKYKIAVQPRF